MATTPALDFVLLYVTNIEESLAYYTQTIGLKHDPAQNSPFFRGFTGDETAIPFGIALPTDDSRRPGMVELYFKTDDAESMRSVLIDKGVHTTAISHKPFGSIFTVDAPDAHLVTMLQEPAR
jgi:catechol 2,3-dioxygenase-like lactoylglutathione lyase family enzyme